MGSFARFFGPTFGRHTLSGALATGADFVVASAVHTLVARPALATFLGCVVGGSAAFALGRHFSFRAARARALPQLVRFGLVWAGSATLNSTGVPALLTLLDSFALAWLVVRGAVFLGFNYPLSRWFVFARRERQAELSAP